MQFLWGEGVMISAYPEWGWHLVNHISNVLKACTMANETVAIEYNEAFHKRAFYSEVARGDLINKKIWLVKVGPHKGRIFKT